MKQIIDGNHACSMASYLFTEIASIYPITPASPMASNMDFLSNGENFNLFSTKVKVVEMQSEAGAAGTMHGALITGALATTFTASQGLLLMIPNMYKIAGECLPGVIHVASRSIATHALSIFGDHSDIYAARMTGFCMLASTNPEQAYHMASITHLSAIKGSLPFLHFFDGFRTSHELNVVETLEEKDLLALIDKEKLQEFKSKSLNIGKPISRGMSETEDIYFQSIEARSIFYKKIPDIVNYYMQEINKLAKTDYKPFNYYGTRTAENIIIAMGSVCDTIKLVVEEENKKGKNIGMVEVHLYRPFSTKYLKNILPVSVKKIAVLDRTKELGSIGEPLYLDVLSALKDMAIEIVGGRYGISSKNTTPSQIYSVYEMLEKNIKNNFTIGIIDDLNHTSLEEKEYSINLNAYEIKIYGFGSDGMVSASKDILSILGDKNYIQGYFEYDSKKSGGVTVSHLRVSENRVNAPYYGTNIDLLVVTKIEYFEKYNMLKDLKNNSILLINVKEEEIFKSIREEDIKLLEEKEIQIYLIDADQIANKYNLNGKISKIMEMVILDILNVKNAEEVLINRIEKQFKTKGEEIVNKNGKAIKEAIVNVKKLRLISSHNPIEKNKPISIYEKISQREGNQITVSETLDICDGAFPGGLSSKEKRSISKIAPKWISENCIQCGMCSMVCPHAVIRPFLIKEQKGIELIGNNEYHYVIMVSERDCTGCGLCVKICPGKNGQKALFLGKVEQEKIEQEKYFENYINPKIIPKFTVKGSQLEKPLFAFPGACAGCGETAYIKLFTQLYGEQLVIANATGCSSIYSGSAPSTAYSIPWANSLFEDNAEFAYGMHISYEKKRETIKKVMESSIDAVNQNVKKLYTEYLQNDTDFEITKGIKELLKKEEIPKELKELIDYIPSRTILAVGGDGWAYDIGFSGIDHVLSSNENIKILVLDTESYSNTGGQKSKSTRTGAVAEFANLGCKTEKKDLFRLAMNYPNCYVASISLGANMMQSIKAIKEAMEHKGPSLIIAYSTCVEQGIHGGMNCSLEEQKLAVEVGYTLLMRYKPEENKLYMDSKKPNFEKYIDFLHQEIRYKSLSVKNPEKALELLEENKRNAQRRYAYFEKIVKE